MCAFDMAVPLYYNVGSKTGRCSADTALGGIHMFEEIRSQARDVMTALLEVARLKEGDIVVVGCSSSEVGGHKIGSGSSPEIADAIFQELHAIARARGIFLAAQCCEHLNRAIILEQECARRCRLDPVNVVPQPKAGGSFATAAYHGFTSPVAVEQVRAQAGIDIGDTLIGMHLQAVAVPVRIPVKAIGEAHVVCARTRPKFIGGVRAHYDDSQM